MPTEAETSNVKSRYRKTRFMLLIGVALIGFTRLEDRAILRIPGPAADAMAAMAIPPAEEVDDGSYADEPDGVVRVANVTRLPRNRIRRALRERDLGTVAARGPAPAILAPDAAAPGDTGNAVTASAGDAFTPAAAGPLTLASATPRLGPVPNSVFSASPPPSSSGGTNPPAPPPPDDDDDPVTAVPEPATWLSLMLGLFAIGAMLRRRGRGALQPLLTR